MDIAMMCGIRAMPAPENIKAMSAAPGGDLLPVAYAPNKYLPPRTGHTHISQSSQTRGPKRYMCPPVGHSRSPREPSLVPVGEITRPHHHHPRIAKKSFSRLSSLLSISLSSPPPHPPLAA
jgi:hypothetical protein